MKKLGFILASLLMAGVFSCSDESVSDSIMEDLSTKIWLFPDSLENSSGRTYNLTPLSISYPIDSTVTSSRIISDSKSKNFLPGWKIKKLKYLCNYKNGSQVLPKTIKTSDETRDGDFESILVKLEEEAFYVSEADEIKYRIEFKDNGGEPVSAMEEISYTAAVTLPSTTRDGYYFGGWIIGNILYQGGQNVSRLTPFDGDTVNAYAKWIKDPVRIYFHGNGGTIVSGSPSVGTIVSDDVYYVDFSYATSVGVTQNLSPGFHREGYWNAYWTLNGNIFGDRTYWYDDYGHLCWSYSFQWTPTALNWPSDDIHVYMKWDKQQNDYNFWSGGENITGKADASFNNIHHEPVAYGTVIILPNGGNLWPNNHKGYVFREWWCYSGDWDSGMAKSAGDAIAITSHYTFDAQWDARTITVVYNANGGTFTSGTPTSVSVNYESPQNVYDGNVCLTPPVNKVFNGWSLASNGNGSRFYAASSIGKGGSVWSDSGLVFYAQWRNRVRTDSLPSGVKIDLNTPNKVKFSAVNATLWTCNASGTASSESTSYEIDYSSLHGTYLITVFLKGKTLPSSFYIYVD